MYRRYFTIVNYVIYLLILQSPQHCAICPGLASVAPKCVLRPGSARTRWGNLQRCPEAQVPSWFWEEGMGQGKDREEKRWEKGKGGWGEEHGEGEGWGRERNWRKDGEGDGMVGPSSQFTNVGRLALAIRIYARCLHRWLWTVQTRSYFCR